MRARSCGLSDIGRRRQVNEDSFLADDGLGLYIVADGVGGQAKGEIASSQAVEEIYGFVSRGVASIERFLEDPGEQTLFAVRRLLESGVQAACYMVHGLAELSPEHKGMSTTISALLLAGRIGIVAQVGDSRIYRHRGGRSEQLTEDHTLINYKVKHGLLTPEEAKKAPGKNVITRAVGHHDYVNVDTFECGVQPGDRFMLCSDGLHGYLRHETELGSYLAGNPIDGVCEALIDLANTRGGKDNITVLIVDIAP